MLTHFDVVVAHAPQCVAVRGAWRALAACSRPRRRRDLQYEPGARLIPYEHTFRMTPRSAAVVSAPLNLRGVIKLVIPNYVVKGTVIGFVVSCTYGIGRRVTNTSISLLERSTLAARIDILLAKRLVLLHDTAKQTASCCSRSATGEGGRVELENEPPVHRMISLE